MKLSPLEVRLEDSSVVLIRENGQDARNAIPTTLEETADTMTPVNLVDAIGNRRGYVRKLLHRMVKAEEVKRAETGRYCLQGQENPT